MRCVNCDHYGLCAPDCPIAPWNTETGTADDPSPFVYLLRQRRWSGRPVDRRDTWFADPDIRREQHWRFFKVEHPTACVIVDRWRVLGLDAERSTP